MFGLFRMPRFLRRFIRRRTAKMPASRALEIKEKLSIAYAFVAWNLFGVLAYMAYSGRWTKVEEEEPELSVGRQYVKMLNLRNVQLSHIKGISSVQHYDLTKEEGFKNDDVEKDKELLEE